MREPKFRIGDTVVSIYSSFKSDKYTVTRRLHDIDVYEKYYYMCDNYLFIDLNKGYVNFVTYSEDELIKVDEK